MKSYFLGITIVIDFPSGKCILSGTCCFHFDNLHLYFRRSLDAERQRAAEARTHAERRERVSATVAWAVFRGLGSAKLANFAKFCKFLAGSFSAVSKRNFARKYAFDSIFQALQDLHTFAPLQSQSFSKMMCNQFSALRSRIAGGGQVDREGERGPGAGLVRLAAPEI